MIKKIIYNAILIFFLFFSTAKADLPVHFDWRNVNESDYMTSVKDQGLCGSCWAFTAVGTVEAQYNIFWDWPNYDIDLSEENLISCSGGGGDCSGGSHSSALDYIKDPGITDESCFPYVDQDCNGTGCLYGSTNATCNDKCSECNIRLWNINSVVSVGSSVEAIKSFIYNNGPIAVAFDFNDVRGYFDQNGIWRCPNPSYTNHCVILVGWDETYDYWIAKNSWGENWSENGYFKIGFGVGFVEQYAYGADISPPELHKFWAGNNAFFSEQGYVVIKGAFESGDDCSSPPSGSFILKNDSNDIVAYITSEGDMFIEGSLSSECDECDDPTGSAFIVKDQEGKPVSFIDSIGTLCLFWLYQNPE